MFFMNEFLKAENRCGFWVDESRKMLWKIELDIMEEVDRICKKYNIKYSILGGALIGAIRHKGFIPWDDDMDIGMLRDDYNRFLEVAPKELDARFFLQTGINDEGYYDLIVRVRDKNSTGICHKDLDSSCNNGVFIEIYPFDSVTPNKIKYRIQLLQIRICSNILYFSCYKNAKNFKEKINIIFANLICRFINRETIYNCISNTACRYNSDDVDYVDELVTPYNCKYLKKDMSDTVEVPYEYLMLSIPVGYENCLRTTYGEYMKLPPVEERGAHHKKIVYYDPFHPYYDEEVKVKARQYFNE